MMSERPLFVERPDPDQYLIPIFLIIAGVIVPFIQGFELLTEGGWQPASGFFLLVSAVLIIWGSFLLYVFHHSFRFKIFRNHMIFPQGFFEDRLEIIPHWKIEIVYLNEYPYLKKHYNEIAIKIKDSQKIRFISWQKLGYRGYSVLKYFLEDHNISIAKGRNWRIGIGEIYHPPEKCAYTQDGIILYHRHYKIEMLWKDIEYTKFGSVYFVINNRFKGRYRFYRSKPRFEREIKSNLKEHDIPLVRWSKYE